MFPESTNFNESVDWFVIFPPKPLIDGSSTAIQMATMSQPITEQLDPRESGQRDSTKIALILAGEVLIARDGIDGASLREIAAQAGQRNHHAVQYHFGSREALVQAIFDFRMEQMEPTRGAMLECARAKGLLGDIRTLIEIIFLPQIELIDAYGDNSYAAFLNAYLLRYQASSFGDFGERITPNLAQTLALLRDLIATLPEAVAQRRLVTACFMFLNILVIHMRGNGEIPENFEAAVEDTIGQIVEAMTAPYVKGV